MSSWRDRIVTDSEKEPASKTSSWRDRIVTESEEKIAPTELSFLDKVAAIPSGLANAASSAGDYLGRSISGEIPLSEQLDRAGTLARGAGDAVQAIGDLPAQGISKLLGLDYEGAGAKETAKLLDKVGAGSMESMEQSDAKFPGARGLGQALPLAVMPANAAGVVAGSVLGSYGSQVADKGSASAKDVVEDTALGLGMYGGLKGASKAINAAAPKVKDAAAYSGKVGLKVLTDTSPEMVDELLKTPQSAIKAAKTSEELAQSALDNVAKLKDKVSAGSSKAFDILESEAIAVPKETIVNAIDDARNNLTKNGIFTSELERDVAVLDKIKERVSAFSADELKGSQVKNFLQQLDSTMGEMNKNAGYVTGSGERAMIAIRSNVDKHLKELSPEYANQMKKVAADAGLLSDAKKVFGNESTVQSKLSNLFGKNTYNKELLTEMDGALGTSTLDDIKASGVARYFERDTTNGSRKTVLGSFAGGAIGIAGGPIGSLLGGAIGAGVGSSLDKYARPLAAKAIRLAQQLDASGTKLGKYAPVLEKAAQKGAGQLLLTHQLLMKNPDYVKAISEP
jgi:hypothetical protein